MSWSPRRTPSESVYPSPLRQTLSQSLSLLKTSSSPAPIPSQPKGALLRSSNFHRHGENSLRDSPDTDDRRRTVQALSRLDCCGSACIAGVQGASHCPVHLTLSYRTIAGNWHWLWVHRALRSRAYSLPRQGPQQGPGLHSDELPIEGAHSQRAATAWGRGPVPSYRCDHRRRRRS